MNNEIYRKMLASLDRYEYFIKAHESFREEYITNSAISSQEMIDSRAVFESNYKLLQFNETQLRGWIEHINQFYFNNDPKKIKLAISTNISPKDM